MSLLSVQDMKTDIGQYAVLHGVSFEVPEGGVFVLLGRNGAGKTTTLRSIMGLWTPSPGSVVFNGQDITRMHTADIANPAKPLKVCLQWTELVMEEFFRQGDLEQKLGMPISPFYDREKTSTAACQMGFINVIVSPLVEAFADFIDLPEMTAHLGHNRSVMEKEAVAAELERVTQLKADGVLTDDEFATAKAAILAGKPSPF